jgi:ketosteroid isomerase-like protein
MSLENVEIVRNLYAGLNRAGAARLLALPDAIRRETFEQLFDPELEIRQSAELVFDTAGTFRGYEGFVEAARELVEALGDIQFEVGKGFESGDKVVFEVRARASGRGSGVPVETRLIAHLWELTGGLVRRWIVYPTLEDALEAASLSEQAMSRENVEIVRRLYDAIDRGDTTAVLGLYDPEIEWHFARSPFRNLVRHDVYRGRDGLRDFIRERYEDAWESITDELVELIDAGEHVISIVNTQGRGRRSGAQAEKTHAGVWTIRDGKVVQVVWFPGREEALGAAGLSE